MWYVRFNHPKGVEEARVFEGLTVDDIWPPFEEACTDWGLSKKYGHAVTKHDLQIVLSRYEDIPIFHQQIRDLTTVRKVPHRTVGGQIVLLA